jgi:predicted ATPase
VKSKLFETLKVVYSNKDKIHLFFPETYQSPDTVILLSEVIIEQSKSKEITIDTSSEILLYAIRLAVKKKFLKPEEVFITFFDNYDNVVIINIDNDGRIKEWPEGFFDIIDFLTSELLSTTH